MVRESYLSRKVAAEVLLKKLKKKDYSFSVFRFLLFLFAIISFYLALSNSQPKYFIATAAFFILFLWMLKKHQKIREAIKEQKSLIQVNQDEINYLSGDTTAFDGGSDFINSDHLYAVDLDIFGKNSLFAHINRTSTIAGRQRLAKELASPTLADIEQKQEAVTELSRIVDWRQSFAVKGKLMDENPTMEKSLDLWRQMESPSSWLKTPILLYTLGSISCLLLLNFFIYPSFANFYYLLMALGLNFLIVSSQMIYIKREAAVLGNVSTTMNKYSSLLRDIENLEVKSNLLQKLKSSIASETETASATLAKLGKILSGFDQMGNVLVMLFANGLFHYHLHLMNRLAMWKSDNARKMHRWLEVIAEFDKWNSIANFVYNHPEFTLPEVSDQREMNAEELGHPFLPKAKRVDNPLSFHDTSFIILTGSNMSGKSTFLRAIGVNLVLMQIGSTVCAKNMKSFPFNILTSMRQLDSLASGESYFQAEVLRLKKIKNELDAGKHCFVLLDEILRGTNSDDKRRGTELFLKNICSNTTLGVVATHDIDIADLAAASPNAFKAKYFESKVENEKLMFDYQLRNGICTTPNAIDLMKAEGII